MLNITTLGLPILTASSKILGLSTAGLVQGLYYQKTLADHAQLNLDAIR